MPDIIEKAKSIRLLILDVDGVLTNGLLYYVNETTEARAFHIQDGLGIKMLQSTGIHVAVISAKKSSSTLRRLRELKIKEYYLGAEDKLPAYEELKTKLQLENHQIAYMGDDLPDLPLLRRAGLAITVPKAPIVVKKNVHYITKLKGGKGAVREVCEFILQAQDKLDFVLESYLTK